MDIIIALDIGTTSICALAFSAADGGVRACMTTPNDATLPAGSGGRHEQSPQTIVDAAFNLIRSLAAKMPENSIRGIALTGQMHGVLLADGANCPLTPLITWRDTRTLADEHPGSLADARRRLAGIPLSRRGCELHAGYGGATLCLLQARNMIPENARALAVTDYIAARLCGVAATDIGFAASWGLLNLTTRDWDVDAVDALSIPRAILPPVKDAGEPLGTIRSEMAAQLGLPKSAVILAPLGDNQASVIGVAGFREEMVVNIGTGAQISIPHNGISTSKGLETRPLPRNRALLVGASLCGGWAYDYLRRFLGENARLLTGIEVPGDVVYSKMEEAARAVKQDELTVDTRFAGTRSQPELRGMIAGIGTANFTVGHLAHAFSVGIVGELAAFAETAGGLGRLPVAASGNGVRENILIQDEIRRRFGSCRLRRVSEEAALGAAYNGAVALGLLSEAEVNRLAGEAE